MDNPVLLAEIVFPGSERTDHTTKLIEYANIPGLRYYLVIEQESPVVLNYRFSDGRSEVTIVRGLEDELTISDLNLRVPLTDLYARIAFPDTNH